MAGYICDTCKAEFQKPEEFDAHKIIPVSGLDLALGMVFALNPNYLPYKQDRKEMLVVGLVVAGPVVNEYHRNAYSLSPYNLSLGNTGFAMHLNKLFERGILRIDNGVWANDDVIRELTDQEWAAWGRAMMSKDPYWQDKPEKTLAQSMVEYFAQLEISGQPTRGIIKRV